MNAVTPTLSTPEAALALAGLGIPVFPCVGHPRSKKRKRPLTRRGFHDATTDPETIKAWWAEYPNALIGVPTGKASGIVVLDLDRKNGKDGFADVPDWDTLSPVLVSTTSGGAHVYFAADVYTPCSTGENGVDVRGDGGYVIVPPSPGWTFTGGGFDNLNELPPFPDRFRTKYTRKREELRLQPMGQPGANPHADPAVLEIALAAIPTPEVFEPWNYVAMATHRATHGSAEGFRLFDDWSRKGQNYGGTEERWDALEGSPPTRIGAGTIFHLADQADPSWRDRAEAACPGLQLRANTENIERNLMKITAFFATPKGRKIASRIVIMFSAPAAEAPPELEDIALSDLEGVPLPERRWIVEGLIPDENVTDLSGDGGTGKSLLAMQLGVSMVTGKDWLGFPVMTGRVLYFSCEDSTREVHMRASALCRRCGIGFGDLGDFFLVDKALGTDGAELATLDKGRLIFTPLFALLEAKIAQRRPKLVILDTRADVFAGNEIDRAQVRRFVSALRGLCIKYGLAVLLLSHPSLTGMNSGSGQSGSTAWGNSVRSRLYLDRPKAHGDGLVDPDLRVLTIKKANYGATATEVALRYVAGEFVSQQPAILSGLDQQARGRIVEEKFLELLRNFELQGRNVGSSPGPTYAPALFAGASEGVIGKGSFRTAMERLFTQGRIGVKEFGPPSKRRSRIVEVTA